MGGSGLGNICPLLFAKVLRICQIASLVCSPLRMTPGIPAALFILLLCFLEASPTRFFSSFHQFRRDTQFLVVSLLCHIFSNWWWQCSTVFRDAPNRILLYPSSFVPFNAKVRLRFWMVTGSELLRRTEENVTGNSELSCIPQYVTGCA